MADIQSGLVALGRQLDAGVPITAKQVPNTPNSYICIIFLQRGMCALGMQPPGLI